MLNSEACYSFWEKKKQKQITSALTQESPQQAKECCLQWEGRLCSCLGEWDRTLQRVKWGKRLHCSELCQATQQSPQKRLGREADIPRGLGMGSPLLWWRKWRSSTKAPQEIGEIDVYWAASIGWVPWPKISLTFLLITHLWCLMLVANLTESKITLEASLWAWVTHCSNACHHSTGQGSGLHKKKKWSWEPAFNTLCLLTVDTVWPAHLPAAVTSSVVNWTVKVWA